LNHAEEYARDDLRGSVACVLCPALLALHPRYWQYFLRGSGMGKGSNGFRLTN
jgi:hypothetical protein